MAVVLDMLLTAEEIADRFKLAKSTIYKLTNEGIIPAIKIGKSVRYVEKDVQATVDKLKKKPIGIAA